MVSPPNKIDQLAISIVVYSGVAVRSEAKAMLLAGSSSSKKEFSGTQRSIG